MASIKDKTVVVTGGAGLVGSHICDQLVHEGAKEIRVVDNFVRGTEANLEQSLGSGKVKLFKGDIRDRDFLAKAISGSELVFHQAAIRITQCAAEPRECLEVLVDGTYNVLEACVNAKVEKLVAASSASVYGMADKFPTQEVHHLYGNRTWYGGAKVANEQMLRAFNEMYGLNYVALRYFNIYGPRMDVFGAYTEVLIRWLECLDRGERPKIFGDGSQTMDFIYIEDVARSNILAMESPASDRYYNVASGAETSLKQLLEALLKVVGSKIEPEFVEERKVNSVRRRLASTEAAKKELGFVASVGLEDGLTKLVEWRKGLLTQSS